MVSVFNTFEKNIHFILYYVYVHISPCGYVHASAGAMMVRVKGGYDPPNMVNKLRLSKRAISCSKRRSIILAPVIPFLAHFKSESFAFLTNLAEDLAV